MTLSDDLPIGDPTQDRYGLDAFAAALAESIWSLSAPSGTVLAVNGSWGSGKRSAINLIKHHLQAKVAHNQLVVVPFNPWWFPGSDALTLAFFRELNAAVRPSLPARLRRSLAWLGQGVSATGAVAGALANLGVPGLGKVISEAAGALGKATRLDRSLEAEHREVSNALARQSKRFLVIIDDMDRLNPDDALTVFRLVKSVGRLPKVIYLLAFDRQIAERIVTERFPSEGASYLEKIVQGVFELPPPPRDVLRQQCAEAAFRVMGEPERRKTTRFWNVFHDVVSPTLNTPRDVIRLSNQLSATWPAVAGEVDRADFLAITALQLAEPVIYAAVRSHGEELCGTQRADARRQADLQAQYDTLLRLADRSERDQRRLRIGLRRLFPQLDAIYGNTFHGGEHWRRDRLLASSLHFPLYFAFSLSNELLPAQLVTEVIARADDRAHVQTVFEGLLARRRRSGETQASLLLEELTLFASDVSAEKICALTTALVEIADRLNVDADAQKGFAGMGNNNLRLHWLCNALVTDRFPEAERGDIYKAALEEASVHWAVGFAERCLADSRPEEDGRDRGEPIVAQDLAEAFRTMALDKLRRCAADGALIAHPRLSSLLFAWERLAQAGSTEVRAWTDKALDEDAFVLAMARQMPSTAWGFAMGLDEMGDRIQQPDVRVDAQIYADLLNVERLQTRMRALIDGECLVEADRALLNEFLALPRGPHGRNLP